MSKIIPFDEAKAKEARTKNAASRAKIADIVQQLSDEIRMAQQSYYSLELINNGYCGSGLNAEITKAQTLPAVLKNAGRMVQQLQIMVRK